MLGDPKEYAVKYASEGAEELLFMDVVATLYGRNQLAELLEKTTDGVFIPVTVGGGIHSVEEAQRLFNAGADKVAINTAAIKNPKLITEIANRYGSQAIVVSIEAKRMNGGWEAYTDNGREKTGKDAIQWAFEAQSLGAGEILMTSIDREGTGKGMDLELLRIGPKLDIPLMASGGVGNPEHVTEARRYADAVAVAGAIHYKRFSIEQLRG